MKYLIEVVKIHHIVVKADTMSSALNNVRRNKRFKGCRIWGLREMKKGEKLGSTSVKT